MTGLHEDYHASGHLKEYFDYRGYPLEEPPTYPELERALKIVAICIRQLNEIELAGSENYDTIAELKKLNREYETMMDVYT